MSGVIPFKPGDEITVRVHKADGSVYRWWRATVETVEDASIVAVTPVGNPVHQSARWFDRTEFPQPWAIRSYYFPGRRHTVLEVYQPDGSLYELYADVCSPIEFIDGELHYADYELDVSKLGDAEARIIDEDEFEEAAGQFDYSEAFRQVCYGVAYEALEIIADWQPRGMPGITGPDSTAA